MANDQIKKADNGTYYFRANLGFDHSTGKRIQKYRSGFKTKKEAKEEYAKLVLQFASQSLPTEQKRIPFSPHRSSRSANATMPSPISRVPVAPSFRCPPICLSLRSRISSVPKSVI